MFPARPCALEAEQSVERVLLVRGVWIRRGPSVAVSHGVHEACVFGPYRQVRISDFSLQEFYLRPDSSRIVLGLSSGYSPCTLRARFLAAK